MEINDWKVIRITDISLNNGFKKQILLLVARLNKFGIESSKESDFVLLEQE